MIIDAIEHHFRALRDMTELELKLIGDAKKGAHNLPLGERLREEVRQRFASSTHGR